METKTLRLLSPILVGHEQVPANGVVEIEAGEAAKLLECDPPCAVETDAIERYPCPQPILRISDFGFWGHEKFPRDRNLVPPPGPGAFAIDADRHVEDNIRAGAGGAAPAGGKEPVAAEIFPAAKNQKRAEEEDAAAAEARRAAAVPVMLVDEDKPKGKGK